MRGLSIIERKAQAGGGNRQPGRRSGAMRLARASCLKSSHTPVKKSNGLNRRKAIRMHCIDCAGFIKPVVRNCTFKNCELYPYRSGKGKQAPVMRERAIRKYCLGCMNGQRYEVRLCPSSDCTLYQYRMTKKALQNFENEHIGRRSGVKKYEAIPEHSQRVRL